MSVTNTNIGEIEDCSTVKEILWKIPDFMSLSNPEVDYYESPDFDFADSVWCLGICSSSCDTDHDSADDCDCDSVVHLYLCKRKKTETSKNVNLTFEIMKKNPFEEIKYTIKDNVEDVSFGEDFQYYQMIPLLKRSELLECKSTLLPSGTLTIYCCVQTVDPFPGRSPSTKLTELDKLSQDLGDLFHRGANSDVTFQVQDKKFPAHRSILSTRSAMLYSMLGQECPETKTSVVDIKDCDPGIFQTFLYYLYTGVAEDLTPEEVLDLFKIANQHGDLTLRSFCIEFMKHHLSADTVCSVAALAYLYNQYDLFDSAQAFFNKNVDKIFSDESWTILMRENSCLANSLLKGLALKLKIED